MSGTGGELELKNQYEPQSWQEAAGSGQLLSYMWANRPGMNELVPGYRDDEGTGQKILDYMSVPARLAAGPVVQGGTALNKWMGGDQGPDTRKMLTESVLGLLGLNAPVARPAGTLGVFAGRTARTADLQALRDVKGASGPPEAIWELKGWYKDVDGQWKFEIPDVGARWHPNASTIPNPYDKDQPILNLSIFGAKNKLGEILDHPELYEAYPELRDVPVRGLSIQQIMKDVQGSTNGDGSISIGHTMDSDNLSVLMHEVQHLIQEKEGFATGGTRQQFLPAGFEQEFKNARTSLNTWDDLLRKNGVNTVSMNAGLIGNNLFAKDVNRALDILGPEVMEAYKNTWTKYRGMEDTNLEAFRKYENLAGEVEARNVQERMLHPEQYGNHPHYTEGYPTDPQIVTMPAIKLPGPSRYVKGPGGTFRRLDPVDHDPWGAAP